MENLKMNKLKFIGRGSGYNVKEGNVHTSLRVLCEKITRELRKNVYCIHIDGDNFIEAVENEGFSVPHALV